MAKKEVKENKQKGHYFKDMKAELKKVIWPTPKQLMNNTLAVIAFTIIIAVIVFILDLCFNAITENGVTKMQEQIRSSYQTSHNEAGENTTANEANNSDVQTQVIESNNTTNASNEATNSTTNTDNATNNNTNTANNTNETQNNQNSTRANNTNTSK